MFRTRQELQTAARLTQDAEGGGGIMSPLLDAVVGFHTGEAAFRGARCVEFPARRASWQPPQALQNLVGIDSEIVDLRRLVQPDPITNDPQIGR